MFSHDWHSILRIAVIAAASYVLAIGVLRLLGEEALAKLFAYDLLVTVALGSLLAAIPLTSGITVSDGLTVIVVYLILQQAMRWAIKRSKSVERTLRDKPHIAVRDGRFLEDRLADRNVIHAEIQAAVRRAGMASISEALAVVLENDGEWSVVREASIVVD